MQAKEQPFLGHYVSILLMLHPDSMIARHWALTISLVEALRNALAQWEQRVVGHHHQVSHKVIHLSIT